ncbi:sensor of ECF-type sigma factor [Spongiivirga sp. MCCC 1A20706]|uniref:Spy/CpxP family protein refolding chaperone n=1 Tax=Spongiivirga sp. MCCC 1A20706 TaxID=3160963 RepID=UPI0039779C52
MNSITKTILLLFISFSSISFAQGPVRERIKAQKVAFITDQLKLTVDEAEKFWPIYNKFDQSTHQLRRVEMRKLRREFEAKGGDSMSDAEATVLLDRLLKIEDQLHQEKTQLILDLKKVIPAKKIIKLRRVEEEFNKQLIKRFRDRRKKN